MAKVRAIFSLLLAFFVVIVVIDLITLDAAAVFINQPQALTIARLDTSVTIDCLLSERPHTLLWYKNGQLLLIDEGKWLYDDGDLADFSLVIANVSNSDNGTYMCQAISTTISNSTTGVLIVRSHSSDTKSLVTGQQETSLITNDTTLESVTPDSAPPTDSYSATDSPLLRLPAETSWYERISVTLIVVAGVVFLCICVLAFVLCVCCCKTRQYKNIVSTVSKISGPYGVEKYARAEPNGDFVRVPLEVDSHTALMIMCGASGTVQPASNE